MTSTMFKYTSALLCAVLVLSILGPTTCAKFGRRTHSYPKSHGGLSGHSQSRPSYPSSSGLSGSGGGGHSYPQSSSGLSGSGSSHGYPSGGGLSGSGSHSYPQSNSGLSGSGKSHGYPGGSGLSGTGSNSYPPNKNAMSGSGYHGYPSGGSLSGSGRNNFQQPSHITYGNKNYPVFTGPPPQYVQVYQNSGSKYGTILTGLALLNLATLGGSIYANSRQKTYTPKPGEVCKFAIKKENGDYEETKIDCNLISSFIYQEEMKQNATQGGQNTTVTTTTVTNTTSTVVSSPNTVLLPNGTLEINNATNSTDGNLMSNMTIGNVTSNMANSNVSSNTSNSNVADMNIGNVATNMTVTTTTTTTNTTVKSALDVKGPEIAVTQGMKCYVIRTSPTTNMRKTVPCGLLVAYAKPPQKSAPGAAARNIPTFIISSFAFLALTRVM